MSINNGMPKKQTMLLKDVPDHVYRPHHIKNPLPDVIGLSMAYTRREGLKYFYTGKPCINGHYSLRYVSGTYNTCIQCHKKKKAKHREVTDEYYRAKVMRMREKMMLNGDTLYASRPDFLDSFNKVSAGATIKEQDQYKKVLTRKQRIAIRAEYIPYVMTAKMLGAKYNVCRKSICRVLAEK